MQYIYNFLWLLFGIASFGIGFVFFLPALLLVLVSKIVSLAVVALLFSGILTITKILGANAQQMRSVRDTGLSCINKL